MYITLVWFAVPPAKPDDVEAEVYSMIEALGFANIFNPRDGLFLANIKRGQTRQQVQLLYDALLLHGQGRVEFLIAVTPNYWDMAATADIDATALQNIVDYQT